jgi:hypothetical protein
VDGRLKKVVGHLMLENENDNYIHEWSVLNPWLWEADYLV